MVLYYEDNPEYSADKVPEYDLDKRAFTVTTGRTSKTEVAGDVQAALNPSGKIGLKLSWDKSLLVERQIERWTVEASQGKSPNILGAKLY